MKKLFSIKEISVLLLLILSSNKGAAQLPPNDPAFQLVFEDEFLGDSINSTNWARIPPFNQCCNTTGLCSPGSTTSLAYRKWKSSVPGKSDTTNCKVSNGTVKLITRKENYMGEVWNWPECDQNTGLTTSGKPCTGNCVFDPNTGKSSCFLSEYIPFKFTTAMLYSKFKFKFGYFEIKFKLPPDPAGPKRNLGFGPNFWLYSADASLNNYWSEIDIFEINSLDISQNPAKSNEFTNNVHYQGDNNPLHHIQQGAVIDYIAGNQWHTAAANWTPNNIDFYLDGNLVRSFPCSQLSLPPDSLISMPIFIDINSPATNFCRTFDTLSTDGTAFPYTYEIDYVKVWQKKQACDTTKTICNLTATNYESKIYHSVTLGGSSCIAPISLQSNFSVYGQDYILLDEGFSVDNQSNVYINTENCLPNYFGLKIATNQCSPPCPPPASYSERSQYHY